jgi:arylsulfatase A-like enzyme
VLDALRTRGVTLRQFYTPKDCAPSRASTMTGRWPFRVGYYGNPGNTRKRKTHTR